MENSHEGRWRRINYARPVGPGSIHDDDKAREFGFRRSIGFGDAAIDAVMPAILHCYGRSWFEGGWFDLKQVGPLYSDEEVREIARPAEGNERTIAIELVTREGRLTCAGRAGLGTALPWDPRLDGTRGSEVVFPQCRLGEETDEREFVIAVEDFLEEIESTGNDSPWFRGPSPWGGPIAPPIALFPKIQDPWHDLGEGILDSPPMNGGLQLVIDRPILLGERCRASTRLVDKGKSGRCWYRTVEFVVNDLEGRRRATGRQKAKWFAPGIH